MLPLRGKKPAKVGVHDASLDADLIRQWWSEPLNVGVAVPQWYLVLDVDPRNGGVDTLRLLVRELGALPDTRIVRTGSDGLHVWLRTGLEPAEIRGTLGPGVDVKKSGGYVVAPPSVHPETGQQYVWTDDADIADLPPKWAARARRPPRPVQTVEAVADPVSVRGLVRWWCSVLRHTGEGYRNHQLFVSALRLAQHRCLTAEVEKQLWDAALAAGLDHDEIGPTIRSAMEEACD